MCLDYGGSSGAPSPWASRGEGEGEVVGEEGCPEDVNVAAYSHASGCWVLRLLIFIISRQ